MKRLLPLSFLVLPQLAIAQPEKEVIALIDRFFVTMAARDSAGMAALLMPDGVLYAVFDGPTPRAPQTITHKDYLSGLKQGKDQILERYWDPKVRVDGSIATVTASYDFHVNGALSHCGTDVFTLLNDGASWKISGGVFNMRCEGCPESPLGPVK